MRSVVVLGPFRGGTSLVTGILQSLGVFVGRSFFDARTGYPTYEAFSDQCSAFGGKHPTMCMLVDALAIFGESGATGTIRDYRIAAPR